MLHRVSLSILTPPCPQATSGTATIKRDVPKLTLHEPTFWCKFNLRFNGREVLRVSLMLPLRTLPAGDIRDPLKRDVLKPIYERRLMGGSVDSLLGLGRSGGKFTLDTQAWGAQAIQATPYGHCVDSTGGYVVRPQSVG